MQDGETDPLRGQSLCLSPHHTLDSVFIIPVGSLLIRRGRKKEKSVFPNDAILSYLKPANGLVSEQHFSESSPRDGTFL